MHTPGAQVSKCVHHAAKMCTQGAGCTLNFEHCIDITQGTRLIHNLKITIHEATLKTNMVEPASGCP